MAASPDTRLSRKVTKHDEDIRAQGDTLVTLALVQKGHTVTLTRIDETVAKHTESLDRIDETVAGHTESLARIDAAVSAMESHVDDVNGRMTMLGLEVGLLRTGLKTVDGRLVRVERGLSAVDDRLTAVDDRLTAVDDRLTALEERQGDMQGLQERQGGTLAQHGEMLTEILRRLPA